MDSPKSEGFKLELYSFLAHALASFHTITICNMKNWSIQGFPKEPAAQHTPWEVGFLIHLRI
jgi:hypothetical protein